LANIKDRITAIRNAIFGKEVRESIASGIEKINEEVESTTERQGLLETQFDAVLDETTEKDVISTPEITAARVGADNTTHSNLKGRLDAEHNKVMSQLAETESKLDLNNWELQNKTRKQKPLLTIVDDDGHLDVINLLLPLAESLDFKFTATVPGFNMLPDGQASHMKKGDLLLLQSKGHEISSHTYNHINLTEKTEDELIQDFEQMDSLMKEWGIKCTTLCYPFGARNDLAIDVARRYFRGARSTDYGINYSPVETWDLRVINGYRPNVPTDNEGKIELYKTDIDEIVAKKGWGIYSAHLYLDNTQVEIISEIVQYAKSLGVEIVTLNEGLNRFGNIVDVGRYYKDDLTKPHYVIGANGVASSYNLHDVLIATYGRTSYNNEINGNTRPSFFKLGKIYKTRIAAINRTGLPGDLYGNLTTDTSAAPGYNAYVIQRYEEYGTGKTYTRYAIDANTWSSWELQNIIKILPADSGNNSTPLTGFERERITICRINTASGFPENSPGMLTTNRVNAAEAFNFQSYEVAASANVYRRYWTSSGWSPWVKVNQEPNSVAISGSISSESVISEFPEGKISYFRVVYSNRTGFPSSQGGVLITNRMFGDAYAYQEYDCINSHDKYKRYWDGDAWSDWKQISMV